MWSPWRWLAGVEVMEPETEYVYFRLCMHLYDLDGLVVADADQANARRCRMSTRTYRKHKEILLDLGKFEVRDGLLWNERCAEEIEKVKGISEGAKLRADKRWQGHQNRANSQNARKNTEKNSRKLAEKAGVSSEFSDGFSAEKDEKNTLKNPELSNKNNETGDACQDASTDACLDACSDANSEKRYIPKGISPCSPPNQNQQIGDGDVDHSSMGSGNKTDTSKKDGKPSAKKSANKSGWPDGFDLSPERRGKAVDYGTTKTVQGIAVDAISAIDWSDEWAKFEAHHHKLGSKFVDWDAAWKTWYMNAVKFAIERADRQRTVGGARVGVSRVQAALDATGRGSLS